MIERVLLSLLDLWARFCLVPCVFCKSMSLLSDVEIADLVASEAFTCGPVVRVLDSVLRGLQFKPGLLPHWELNSVLYLWAIKDFMNKFWPYNTVLHLWAIKDLNNFWPYNRVLYLWVFKDFMNKFWPLSYSTTCTRNLA